MYLFSMQFIRCILFVFLFSAFQLYDIVFFISVSHSLCSMHYKLCNLTYVLDSMFFGGLYSLFSLSSIHCILNCIPSNKCCAFPIYAFLFNIFVFYALLCYICIICLSILCISIVCICIVCSCIVCICIVCICIVCIVTLKLVTTNTSVTGGEGEGEGEKQLPSIELLSQLKI